ncbi:hypothetical protein AVEN_71331-1 [Araneus ventricosus]|uniref:Uncharacterized protein n=1 Tax=Araneus ventricosus TaxID=182803 RepID=A0A4Y2BJA7_ARAVE|nr:hypothetical protein AVEN_71331-1 [Araneus ventricosus]
MTSERYDFHLEERQLRAWTLNYLDLQQRLMSMEWQIANSPQEELGPPELGCPCHIKLEWDNGYKDKCLHRPPASAALATGTEVTCLLHAMR